MDMAIKRAILVICVAMLLQSLCISAESVQEGVDTHAASAVSIHNTSVLYHPGIPRRIPPRIHPKAPPYVHPIVTENPVLKGLVEEFQKWIQSLLDKQLPGPSTAPLLPHLFAGRNMTHVYTKHPQYIIVNKHGNGDFEKVQDAIDAVPTNNTRPITIFVGPGVYKEKVHISHEKPYITLQGSGANKTTIEWGDYNGKTSHGKTINSTYYTAAVHVSSDFFTAKGITFKNTAPTHPKVSQAAALLITGDYGAFYKCNFLGHQDTLYDKRGRHFFKDCLIRGSVDFIFGDGLSLYKDCELHVVGNGSLTAQKRNGTNDNAGFSFVNCRIHGNGNVLLGRSWGPYSRVVFIKSYMGTGVVPSGWNDWSKPDNDKTVFYGEYDCFGPGSNTKNRVPYSIVLTDDEARAFMDIDFIDGQPWLL